MELHICRTMQEQDGARHHISLFAAAVGLLMLGIAADDTAAATTTEAQQLAETRPARVPIFRYAKSIGSGMVLQSSPKRAIVWGFCSPQAKVSVAFGGKIIQAAVGPDHATGNETTWRVLLPATDASYDPHTVSATADGTTLTISVLFGDVFMCTGQVLQHYRAPRWSPLHPVEAVSHSCIRGLHIVAFRPDIPYANA